MKKNKELFTTGFVSKLQTLNTVHLIYNYYDHDNGVLRCRVYSVIYLPAKCLNNLTKRGPIICRGVLEVEHTHTYTQFTICTYNSTRLQLNVDDLRNTRNRLKTTFSSEPERPCIKKLIKNRRHLLFTNASRAWKYFGCYHFNTLSLTCIIEQALDWVLGGRKEYGHKVVRYQYACDAHHLLTYS